MNKWNPGEMKQGTRGLGSGKRGHGGVPADVSQDGHLGIELAGWDVDPCARREEKKDWDPLEVLPPLPLPGAPALLPMPGTSAPAPTSLPSAVPALLLTSARILAHKKGFKVCFGGSTHL